MNIEPTEITPTSPEEIQLPECTHRPTRSHFVKQALQDDINNIQYNVIFLMNDLFNSSYMAINTITFKYGG